MTKFTSSNSSMSISGEPSTAMMSADLPASMVPMEGDMPNKSAALTVADFDNTILFKHDGLLRFCRHNWHRQQFTGMGQSDGDA